MSESESDVGKEGSAHRSCGAASSNRPIIPNLISNLVAACKVLQRACHEAESHACHFRCMCLRMTSYGAPLCIRYSVDGGHPSAVARPKVT